MYQTAAVAQQQQQEYQLKNGDSSAWSPTEAKEEEEQEQMDLTHLLPMDLLVDEGQVSYNFLLSFGAEKIVQLFLDQGERKVPPATQILREPAGEGGRGREEADESDHSFVRCRWHLLSTPSAEEDHLMVLPNHVLLPVSQVQRERPALQRQERPVKAGQQVRQISPQEKINNNKFVLGLPSIWSSRTRFQPSRMRNRLTRLSYSRCPRPDSSTWSRRSGASGCLPSRRGSQENFRCWIRLGVVTLPTEQLLYSIYLFFEIGRSRVRGI